MDARKHWTVYQRREHRTKMEKAYPGYSVSTWDGVGFRTNHEVDGSIATKPKRGQKKR